MKNLTLYKNFEWFIFGLGVQIRHFEVMRSFFALFWTPVRAKCAQKEVLEVCARAKIIFRKIVHMSPLCTPKI